MTGEQGLEALFVANPDFEAIERSRDVFCPFEAIGMVRQEIRHGHFLAYCLDPQRPHGFGSECIRAMLRSAAYAHQAQTGFHASGNITPLDVHLMDFEKTQIRREWRSIDLLAIVSDEKLIVAIELKIDSIEHSGQLGRYRERVTQHWPAADGWRHLFLYLTKHGDDASDDGDGWLALPLELVARELDGVVQRQAGMPDALALLRAYLNMLRRHHLTDEKLEELAAKLWSQHREALQFLMERRPDAASQLFSQIYEGRNDIAAKMSAECGLTIIPDDGSPRVTRFAVKEWDNLPDFLSAQNWTSSNRLLLVEFESSGDKRNLRMRFMLGPSEPEKRETYFRALVNGGAPTTKRKEITNSYTRLATKSIRVYEDDDAEEAISYDRVLEEASRYGREVISMYSTALNKFSA